MNNALSLLEGQQAIHELIARQRPLPETLNSITGWMSQMMPGALVSIMRYQPDRHTLSLVPNDQFSEQYTSLMQEQPVGPDVGTCGPAAHDKKTVITEDIHRDARWDAFREAADREQLRACWSVPIVTGEGELLGTFATYYRTPTYPSLNAIRSLERAAGLTALALLRHRDVNQHTALSEWHRTLFENHPDGVYTFDLEGRFRSCNPAFRRITGYREEQLLGFHFNPSVVPAYRQQTQAWFDRACAGESVTYETMGIHADGHAYHLEITNFPVVLEGQIVGVYGVCREITARKQQDAELRLLKRGIESSPNGILMADALAPDYPVVYANVAFSEITGYELDEILGRNCHFLQGPDTDPASIEQIRAGIRDQTDVDVVLRNYRKDGIPFWNQLRISPVFDEAGICTHFIGIQQDITRQKEQEARIAHQATHDLLTDLPNQALFAERLREAMEQGAGRRLVAVLFMDLDGFKPINEGLGHEVGNLVLKTVAQRLKSVTPPRAVLARMVGDEFAVLWSGCESDQQVTVLADRILETLSEPIDVQGYKVHLSTSIGIATNQLALNMPYELMQYADVALEQAKRQGRNTWQWCRGTQAGDTRHSVTLRHDLHNALAEDQFELYYQPVVDAVSGRIRSTEALVRWHHPSRGMVSPGEFIPLAEQTGQIVPLGRWILRRACQDMVRFNADRERELPVAVNISSLQFHRDGFLADVRQILAETGMPARLLEFEVTESVLLDGTGPVIELMETLKDMGIRVALDDFGTGFSSLSYLRDLPTHKVKLDRSFIKDIQTDRRIAAIVQGVITMAHHMDMCVVAEGIETPEHQDDLARRLCDLLQGYYFARPMPLNALQALSDRLPHHQKTQDHS
ncbi:bifunctional diguanylate cyclase/phosphodiesterase [Marinobacter zhanjiangensis]|uniref:GGDEF domain-containing protein n=1 Tax=Marinobacter zhanjiangensis TaxID=578215 RepID=A0ABQ3AT41_9GAMM|nr:EAL domain-containing protein [Marinobacter zhanjiangensis]GGY66957.1 GGDEF domain-containing protein [Marinobacter zhanjiangensis]